MDGPKHYVDAWKKVSGIKLWKDFHSKEYNPKMERLQNELDRHLKALSFDTKGGLTLSNRDFEGFALILTAGGVSSDGGRFAAWKKLHFDVNLDALVNDFDAELHRVSNEEMADQLSRLAFEWDGRKLHYGQSTERCQLIGISV